MRLSIVTITRNQAQYLPKTIDSVLTSRVKDLQYIIYDAASTDATPDIVAAIDDPRVQYIQRSDSGPADGLNYAFTLAQGDVLGYINGDDFYLPNALEWVVRYFNRHHGVDMVHGGGVIVDSHGNVTRKVFPRPYSPKLAAIGASFVFQQATFFRTSAVRDLRFNTFNHTCWDGEYVRDLALRGCTIRRETVMLGAFRLHPESISGGPQNPQYVIDRQRLARETLGSSVHRCHKFSAGMLRMVFRMEGVIRRPKLPISEFRTRQVDSF